METLRELARRIEKSPMPGLFSIWSDRRQLGFAGVKKPVTEPWIVVEP
jgi:hypothetical protein